MCTGGPVWGWVGVGGGAASGLRLTSPPEPSQWSALLKCDHRMLMANIWIRSDLNSPTLTTFQGQEARGKRQEARGKRQEARGRGQGAEGEGQEAMGGGQRARGKWGPQVGTSLGARDASEPPARRSTHTFPAVTCCPFSPPRAAAILWAMDRTGAPLVMNTPQLGSFLALSVTQLRTCTGKTSGDGRER